MKSFAALILTATAIGERLTEAKKLRDALADIDSLATVAIHPAVYWHDRNSIQNFLQTYPGHTFTQAYLDRCRQGQLCCTMSHISAWRYCLEHGHDGVFVFEDDLYLKSAGQLEEIVHAVSADENLDWLRLHVYKLFVKKIRSLEFTSLYGDDPSTCGFAAYYVSKRGAARLIKGFRWIYHHVDVMVPHLRDRGALNCKTVKESVVEHPEFEGRPEAIKGRHPMEHVQPQTTPSTIYSSPRFNAADPLYIRLLKRFHVRQLKVFGYTVLKRQYSDEAITRARERVLNNVHLLKNTRPTPSSGHLAGFHRYPELEPLHTLISTNKYVRVLTRKVANANSVKTIGLSDITVNRSQQWHKDLLRGKFQEYLKDVPIYCTEQGGGVYKALLYLQPGTSLQVVPGSHLEPVPLDNDERCEPNDRSQAVKISVAAGDVVVLDIRLIHRGSREEDFQNEEAATNPKILVSTVFGATDGALTKAMELGNFHRMLDWDERHRRAKQVSLIPVESESREPA